MNGNELPQPASRREIEWTPLITVIGAVFLISLAAYGEISVWSPYSPDSFGLERDLSVILGFLASTALIATIALVVYQKESQGKKFLIIGMALIVCMLALKASVYLRSTYPY